MTNLLPAKRRTLLEFASKLRALPLEQFADRQDKLSGPKPGFEDAYQAFQASGKPVAANGVVFWPDEIWDPAAGAWAFLAQIVNRNDVFPPIKQMSGIKTAEEIDKLVAQVDQKRPPAKGSVVWLGLGVAAWYAYKLFTGKR